MSDYYHQFLTSMTGVGGNPAQSPQDIHPPQLAQAMALGGAPIPASYQNLGYFTGFPDPIIFNTPKTAKSRRKSAPGLDHVKHRRTRSGCFMCRSRRVKCDESRPICERCKKGNRECVYPEPSAVKGASGQSSSSRDSVPSTTQTASPTSSGDEDDEDDRDIKLDPIPDDEEGEAKDSETQQPYKAFSMPRRTSAASSFTNLQRMGTRHSSETPSQEGNKSSSPSASTGTTSSLTAATYQLSDFSLLASTEPAIRPDWSHLPADFRHHLNFFSDYLTHYHYCMVADPEDFFHIILPSIAIKNEALLYAVVGFAAYHQTLQNPKGKIHEFLQYYNKSVTVLLNYLKRKEKYNLATLLTILQLATIEEYLGDWVNLMGHQKAAYEILTQLFTPQTAMETPMGRMIVAWYARFDVFVAIMGGFPTALPREWFVTFVEFCHLQIAANPEDLNWKIEECSGRLRLISMEMSMLFAKGNRGEISPEQFATEHHLLAKRLQDWKDGWDPAITNPALLVTDFSYRRPLNADDILDPFAPGVLYNFPVFSTTLMTGEWHSIMVMHKCQSSTMPRLQLFTELAAHAYAICQVFEAAELWPHTPKGSLVTIQACIAIAALFLPQDAKHQMWVRRKFALIETMGYIHPVTLRTKMAALFGDPSCARWWLPSDEGFTPILQSIRTFADERNAVAVTAQAENLREVRHVFSKLESSEALEQLQSPQHYPPPDENVEMLG